MSYDNRLKVHFNVIRPTKEDYGLIEDLEEVLRKHDAVIIYDDGAIHVKRLPKNPVTGDAVSIAQFFMLM